jgi:hypothetical protein
MIGWILLTLFLLIALVYVLWYWNLKARALKKLTTLNVRASDRWTVPFLEEKRNHTDPVADGVVGTIMKKNELTQMNHLFKLFVDDNDVLPDSAPQEIKDYFRETANLPSWADPDLIALGQQVYIRHGVWISLLLSYKSLPECYACAKGAEVLFHTARLNEHHGSLDAYSRRIAETAQFVFYAMQPGGLSSEGSGLRAAQKVRLIHAIIRYYLKQKNWDAATYNEPINQQDMAGTLMSFSALILEGLEQLGIDLEPVEQEAYVHCWRVIGHIVGLQPDLIPENAADALKLGHAILDNQIAESDHSKSLMKALLDFQDKNSKPLFDEQGNIAMMRLMMGDKISEMLGVPTIHPVQVQKLGRKLRRIARVMEFFDKSLVLAMVIQFISKLGLQWMITRMTPTRIINFYLPKSLTQDWAPKP